MHTSFPIFILSPLTKGSTMNIKEKVKRTVSDAWNDMRELRMMEDRSVLLLKRIKRMLDSTMECFVDHLRDDAYTLFGERLAINLKGQGDDEEGDIDYKFFYST